MQPLDVWVLANSTMTLSATFLGRIRTDHPNILRCVVTSKPVDIIVVMYKLKDARDDVDDTYSSRNIYISFQTNPCSGTTRESPIALVP